MAHYFVVNNDKNFVAIFSPKCGCTTVKDWFIASLGPSRPVDPSIGGFMIPPSRLSEYPSHRKIFFIRDPYTRVLSFYCKFVIQEQPLWCFVDQQGKHRLEGRSFTEFVESMALLSTRGELLQHHLRPQLEGTEDVKFDYVIPIESFDNSVSTLNDELGISYEPKCCNATDYGSRRWEGAYDRKPEELAKYGIPAKTSFFNDRIIETIYQLYRNDIEFYWRYKSGLTIPAV
jgi:hypothetical protein